MKSKHFFSTYLLSLILLVTGCGSTPSVSTHTVTNDSDSFINNLDGRIVEFKNWTITIDGKSIPIQKSKSTIKIEHKDKKIDIFVNGKQVHDE